MKALQDGRCADAFQLWTSKWPVPADDPQRRQLLASCESLARGGKLLGYDLVKSISVTPHLVRAYFQLRYEKQSLYLALAMYAPTDGDWRLESINWNNEADKVLPAGVVAPFRPPQ